MNTANYVSHKRQQHLDGREELDRTVNDMCANMKRLSDKPKFRTVWNDCLGCYVELR